jgi:hypothetical protein
VNTHIVGQHEIEGVPAGPSCLNQADLWRRTQKLPHQGDWQILVVLAEHEENHNRLPIDRTEVDLLDVLVVDEDVVG